jgi:uncharacterized membrane protein YphA (DoxX/SURF4 family)
MIEYYGENPSASQSPWSALFKTAAILRIGTGTLLLSRHGLQGVLNGYQFFWKEQPWSWAEAFAAAGLPFPHLLAPTAALIIAAVGVSWTLGFLTRFFSLIFLPVSITAVIFLQKAGSAEVEAAWLYTFIAATLLLYGSGSISLDKLFRLGGQWSAGSRR